MARCFCAARQFIACGSLLVLVPVIVSVRTGSNSRLRVGSTSKQGHQAARKSTFNLGYRCKMRWYWNARGRVGCARRHSVALQDFSWESAPCNINHGCRSTLEHGCLPMIFWYFAVYEHHHDFRPKAVMLVRVRGNDSQREEEGRVQQELCIYLTCVL